MQATESLIDYERLVSEAMRDAMRKVLRNVLVDVARDGLPGDHHFYISFHTTAPGVVISKRLLEKYPEEMTIVLQHRFWDLIVHEDRFEVKLQFNSIPERLVVPFEAIRVFVDPSVRFGHQFDDGEADAADGDAVSPSIRGIQRGGRTAAAVGAGRSGDKRRTGGRKRTEKDADGAELGDDKRAQKIASIVPQTTTPKDAGPPKDIPSAATVSPPDEPPSDPESKVISLDKFRKK